MKDTMNTSKIEKAINHLIEMIDEELNKNEPKAYDKLVDTINEKMGDDIFQSRAGSLINIVYDLSEPAYEKKHLCLQSALERANDDAVLLLNNLTWHASKVHSHVNADKPDMRLIKSYANSLKELSDKVKSEADAELSNRVTDYRKDVEKLNRIIEAKQKASSQA